MQLMKRFRKRREQDDRVFFIKRQTRLDEMRERATKDQNEQRESGKNYKIILTIKDRGISLLVRLNDGM